MRTRLLVVVLVLLVLYGFLARLRKEHADVRNRGVNQALAVTWLKVWSATLWPVLVYGTIVYLIITAYFYVKYRQRCLDDPAGRMTYQQDELHDHLHEALMWPQRDERYPSCLP